MPQLDLVVYFNNVFWFVIIVTAFYGLYLRMFLVKIAQVIKMRKRLATIKPNYKKYSKTIWNTSINGFKSN